MQSSFLLLAALCKLLPPLSVAGNEIVLWSRQFVVLWDLAVYIFTGTGSSEHH